MVILKLYIIYNKPSFSKSITFHWSLLRLHFVIPNTHWIGSVQYFSLSDRNTKAWFTIWRRCPCPIASVVNLKLFLTIWLVGRWQTLHWSRWNRTCSYSSVNMRWRRSLTLLDLLKVWRPINYRKHYHSHSSNKLFFLFMLVIEM